MIKKCEHPGCNKAGCCKAPKDRSLTEYWYFCKEHAAEYNQNWDYYADMTEEEIEAEWERENFGIADKDIAEHNKNKEDYLKLLKMFLDNPSAFDYQKPKTTIPSQTVNAFKIFELPISSSWNEVSAKYRALAKKHHPDTAKNKTSSVQEFTKITAAYEILKKYFHK